MIIDWAIVALLALVAIAALTLWKAHTRADVQFNLLDLLMENGRVSKIACAFMLVLGVSTWVIVNLTVSGRLTEGHYLSYIGAWVAPLVAKVVFNKNETPKIDSKDTE